MPVSSLNNLIILCPLKQVLLKQVLLNLQAVLYQDLELAQVVQVLVQDLELVQDPVQRYQE